MALNKFFGLPVGKNLTLISSNSVLDKETGIIKKFDLPSFALPKSTPTTSNPPPVTVTDIKKEVEVVTGIDVKTIFLTLFDSSGEQASPRGFLIEVYESGSNGVLTKMGAANVVDPITDEILEEGYETYFILESDKE